MKYRLPILLCDLEGVPQAQAAEAVAQERARTLRRQLAEARDRLKARLTNRGLAPDESLAEVRSSSAERAPSQRPGASLPSGRYSTPSILRSPPARCRPRRIHLRTRCSRPCSSKADTQRGGPPECRADGVGSLGRPDHTRR